VLRHAAWSVLIVPWDVPPRKSAQRIASHSSRH
jgi:hypothetical protein